MAEINQPTDARHQIRRSTRLEQTRIWEWDLVTNSIYHSPDWKRARGHEAGDMLQTPDYATQFVHPDDRAKREKLHDELRAGEREQIEYVHRVKRSDGSWGRIMERTHSICNAEGQPIRLVGCEVDASTDNVEAEKLHKSSSSTIPQVDSLPIAVVRFENHLCVYVNKRWSEMTGRPMDSALGEGWLEAIHPDDRDQLLQFKELHREGIPGESVVVDGVAGRHLNPDGSINWFLAKALVTYGMDGILESSSIAIVDVTQRKKLEQHQKRLIEILEATSDFIGMATLDCKILWHNKSLTELRPDLIPGEDADYSVAHPEWSRKIMGEVAIPAAIEHGSWSGKMAIFDSDGNEVPVSQVLIAHKGPDGSVEALSTIMRDISEQEKTESALRLSERNYSSLAATAPVGIFRMSDPTNCIYVNENWSKQTGLSFKEALGTGWMKVGHPDDIKTFQQKAEAFASDPKQIVLDGYETQQILPDGSTHWVTCHLAKELDDEGNLTGYVGTLTDIDRVKRTEEEFKELNRRLHDVLVVSSIGIWEWIWKDQRLVWDEKMLEIYGVDPEDFRGIYDDWNDRIHPDDLKRVREEEQHFANTGQDYSIPFEQEFRIVRPSGEVRYIYSSVHSEIDDHGAPMRAVGLNVDITHRRAAEVALRESENELRRITDNLPGMVYRYFLDSDGNTGWNYVSPQVRELFGLEPEEIIANSNLLWELTNPTDLERLFKRTHESAKDFSRFVEEFSATIPGKGLRWFQANSQPRKTENGSVVWDGFAIDITDRKTIEIELQATKYELERVSENIPGVVSRYFLDSDGNHGWSYLSSQVKELFGIDASELIADSELLSQLVEPTDMERVLKRMHESAKDLSPFAEEFRVTVPGKGTRWFQENSQPQKTEDGGIIWDGLILDVTDRKEMELALQETKFQMERITKNVPGVIYQHVQHQDGNFTVSFISPQCHDMFGLTPEEVMRDVNLLLDKIYPEDAERVREATTESARTLKPLKVEYRVSLPGKGLRWHQSIGQPFRFGDNGTVWNGMVLDVTDRKEAELANDVLAKATKTKDEFLANMSHELRTPLTAILAMTDGLQQGMFGKTTAKQMESLKIVEQSGEHLLDLINEVLDLAKIESGQTELEFSYIGVSELCESCLNFVTQQAEQKQIELSLKVPWNLPRLGADEKRTRQMLINLLSNAVKFTPKCGQVKLEVETLNFATADLAPETLRISVSDTGIGIKNDQLESLFEPFVQVDSSLTRQHGGTGLGLSLVKQFVELHQGKVHVSSEPGQGSCFTIDLPFRKVHTEQADHTDLEPSDKPIDQKQRSVSETSKRSASNIASAIPLEGDEQPLILLAEDNDLVAQSIVPILEHCKFKVIRAVNGHFAVEMAREHSPDLILMDVQMPEMDGLEATRQIRSIEEISQLPIIALSGFAKPEDSQRCIEAGASLFMAKPLRMQELTKSINSLLSEHKSTKTK